MPAADLEIISSSRDKGQDVQEHLETPASCIEKKGKSRTSPNHLLYTGFIHTTEVRCVTYKWDRGQAARSSFRELADSSNYNEKF